MEDSKNKNLSANQKLGIVFDNLTGFSMHEDWSAENIIKRIRKNVISDFCESATEDIKEMDKQEIEWYLKTEVI